MVAKLEDGNAAKNLKVWRTDNGEQTVAFVQKNQSALSIQYTHDEKYCARSTTNEIAFYEATNMNTVWEHLRVEGVTEFQLSPGENNNVIVFVPEKKGHPAKAAVYTVPNFTTPVMQKSFFKADKIQFNWNKAGTAVLFLTQTEVDKTGKNYYGETNLYMMNVKAGVDARVTLDKDGPISDFMWSPTGQEFCVVYGYMPSKTTIFDLKANPVTSLPLAPRNTVLYSPHGRLLLVAGFGNLQGQMDIYDRINGMRKLATFEASNATVCKWSPDGKHVLTATTSPRLRVDNGVKIWYALTGDLMYNEEMTELYDVTWRPQDAGEHPLGSSLPAAPTPHASAVGHKAATPAKPAGAYRPPHARGSATPLHFKREDEGGAHHVAGSSVLFGNGSSDGTNGFKPRKREIPGAAPASGAAPGGGVSLEGAGAGGDKGEAGLSKSALKNKKKREAAKKAKEAQAAEQSATGGAEGPSEGQHQANGHMLAPGGTPNKGPRRDHSRTRSRSRGPPRQGPAGSNGNGNGHHREGSGSLGQALKEHYPRHRSPAPGGHPQRQRSQRKKRDDGGQPGQSDQAGPAAAAPTLAPSSQEPIIQQQPRLHLPVPPPEVEITSPLTPVTPGGGSGTPEEKKQRSLLKKLRAIEELKMRFAAGDKLEDTQVKKINTEDSVRKELQGLGWKG
ncbi:hypothetical protein ABW21_db0203039 [Orbilia brochopaga]|nr:hypothetical protein ABW21_db0203039 [Drechslerella brochopaga]